MSESSDQNRENLNEWDECIKKDGEILFHHLYMNVSKSNDLWLSNDYNVCNELLCECNE